MDPTDAVVTMIPLALYCGVLFGPFVQEDAAVVGAAAASASGAGDPIILFLLVLVGLTLSDVWKYWLGRAAITRSWARRFAEKPGVRSAGEKVHRRLGASLMAVRFIPGARIPFYVASGFFTAPFWKFALFIVVSGVAYIAVAFGLLHALGAAAGERARIWAPAVAIVFVVVLLTAQWLRSRRVSG
ncbi:MAG: VTT domain-containing protein, partial [Pseudomonadota bacterium]